MTDWHTVRKQLADLDRRIPEHVKQHAQDLRSPDPVVRARAQDIDRQRNERLAAKFDQLAKAVAKERRKERLVAKIVAAIEDRNAHRKVEAIREKTEKLKRETAKIVRKTAAIEAGMDNDGLASFSDLEKAVERTIADQAAQLADFDRRIAIVTANATAAYREIALQEARQRQAIRAAAESDAAEWIWKANMTSDPVLRAAYMERAQGSELDTDDN